MTEAEAEYEAALAAWIEADVPWNRMEPVMRAHVRLLRAHVALMRKKESGR